MSILKEFRQFLDRGNVVDLAVAVVLGAAFGKIITAIVDGIMMPIVGAVLPQGDWRLWTVTSLNIKVGAVLAAVVDFVIVSAGFDAHRADPLAQLEVTTEAYAEAGRIVREVAERHSRGRIVSVLEGGYDLDALGASVVAHLRALTD